MFKFCERGELKKLKKENEGLRKAIEKCIKRDEELWDALNKATSHMSVFSNTAHPYTKGDNPENEVMREWAERFGELSEKTYDLMLHSAYKGMCYYGDEMLWIR